MSFDPSEHKPQDSSDRPKYVSESGTYMVICTSARTHGETPSGSLFTKLRLQVLYGPIGKKVEEVQVMRILDEKVFRTANASKRRLIEYAT